jgi:glycosyltransferase involved in cell wall biosynthesis
MMRVALVHDWMVVYTGSERVVEQILRLYPQADLYSLVDFVPQDQRAFLQGKTIHTSVIQHFPLAQRGFRNYLALMPLIIEQFDLSAYDLIISSNHAVAKGVLTRPDQLHVSYIHTPLRYAWDMQNEYLRENGMTHGLKSVMVRGLLHYLRHWDVLTAGRVDAMAANSKFVAGRIRKYYQREAEVIYPPVNLTAFTYAEEKEDFYLTVSRMVPYKKIELIVEAFTQMPERKLVVIGDGPDLQKIRKMATPNITVLGYQTTAALSQWMQRAKAFLFAAKEDFGIVMVEAQACGTPVIAYGFGGAHEIVRGLDSPEPTGVFFSEQTSPSIIEAVEQFEANQTRIWPVSCRKNAERFSPEHFGEAFVNFVNQAWYNFKRTD